MKRVALIALATLALGCGEDRASSGGSRASADEPEFTSVAGHVGWTAEEPFVWARPSNDMRDAQYTVRGMPGVELTVSHFDEEVGGGGDVDANVQRWIGQFSPREGEPQTEREEIQDLPVTRVDVAGTFAGRQGMGPSGPPRVGWRLLGAIVEGPEGLVFFKLLGPRAGVEASAEAFEHLVETIHPE
ncbi:MAG: hypothetical protein H6719_05840 [Sandaracinaceae bacterium]|nr:hypothetical protein [Sandaracinaceae bacterium]